MLKKGFMIIVLVFLLCLCTDAADESSIGTVTQDGTSDIGAVQLAPAAGAVGGQVIMITIN